MHRRNKGFTLIELLVVIAIIGILSSVVLASLNSAREKSRDAKRVSDIKQMQLALELYYDSNGQYPVDVASLSPDYIPQDPVDPLDDVAYHYQAYTANDVTVAGNECAAGSTCTSYHLGADLEADTHSALDADSDIDGSQVLGAGDDHACTDATDTNRYCYDLKP